MADRVETQILVAGSGPAGMVAALALARAGFATVLAGPRPDGRDRRTTALMAPAAQYLETLGVAGELFAGAAPLRAMRIVDATSRLVRSPVVTFRAAEIGEQAFGYNVPNRHLNAVLADAVAADGRIAWHTELVADWQLDEHAARAILRSGTTVEALMVAAADGRESPAREAAGIRVLDRAHRQSALVTDFGHQRPHGFVSTEFHTEDGPFTIVPLPGDRSSLVWVTRPYRAAELVELDDAAFAERIETAMQSMLGRVEAREARQVYPLASRIPLRFAARRVALLGEAAHVFPPIGAQGLNLGIRDIQDLVTVAADHSSDPGGFGALSAYDRKRRPDILARSGAVGLLNRSLLSDFLPAQLARGAGLAALGASAPLRGLFMREGLRPGTGLSGLASSLREKVGR